MLLSRLLRIRDTVVTDTPALRATSRSVTVGRVPERWSPSARFSIPVDNPFAFRAS